MPDVKTPEGKNQRDEFDKAVKRRREFAREQLEEFTLPGAVEQFDRLIASGDIDRAIVTHPKEPGPSGHVYTASNCLSELLRAARPKMLQSSSSPSIEGLQSNSVLGW